MLCFLFFIGDKIGGFEKTGRCAGKEEEPKNFGSSVTKQKKKGSYG